LAVGIPVREGGEDVKTSLIPEEKKKDETRRAYRRRIGEAADAGGDDVSDP
jgi:hypothetical protein